MSFEEICRRQPGHNRRCIDGHITGSNKCIGYCTFSQHTGFITEKIALKKSCREHGCWYFIAKPEKTESFSLTIGAMIDLTALNAE